MEPLAWELVKFTLSVIVIPFGIWIVRSHISTKKELADMKDTLKAEMSEIKEENLLFRADVAANYAPKSDVNRLIEQIDSKFANMQTAVTSRIDAVQANIATMIAQVAKK